mgnify:CR=1 FL=1
MPFAIRIVAVGRRGGCADEVERYIGMLRAYAETRVEYIRPESGSGTGARAREEKLICRRWPAPCHSVALSQEGRIYESLSFARWMGQRAAAGTPLVFLVGGAYGLTAALKKQCNEIISLSPLTFSHGIALLVLAEQIYRAFTILKNHPYHK